MAKRKMSKKALNLAEHNRRLVGSNAQNAPSLAWAVAFLALASAALLMYFLK